MFTRKEREQIIEEMAYFSYPVSLSTGKILVKDGDNYIDPDDGSVVGKNDYVVVQYNSKVQKYISKYLPVLLSLRGVPDVNNLNENDVYVKAILDSRRKASGKRKSEPQDVQMAFRMVRTTYEPQFIAVLFQIILWAMVRDDLFKLIKGRGIDCRLEIEVPEDYWDGAATDTEDELENLIMVDFPEQPRLDRTASLEVMVAIVTSLTAKYEEFAKKSGELAGAVFNVMTIGDAEDFDEAGMFRHKLAAALPEFMVKDNDSGGRYVGGSVFFSDEKAGEV